MGKFDKMPSPENEESILEANVKALSDTIYFTVRPGSKADSDIGIAYASVDSATGKVKEILTTAYDNSGRCLYKVQWNFYRNPLSKDAPDEPLIASCRDVDISYHGGGLNPEGPTQRRMDMTKKRLNEIAIQYR